MALKMRLTRKGAKKNPFYRLVVTDSRSPRDGKFVEIIGTYDPRKDADREKLVLQKERYDYWFEKGARPSRTVGELIKRCYT